MTDYISKYNYYLKMFNDYTDGCLDMSAFSGRYSQGFNRMLEAVSYSLKNGGKRVRPVLTLEFCRACGGDPVDALPFALAVEMVHTYSLIHDDLPCMDNDDMRRGKPSNHIVFGYADALLAGDSLLTLAFEHITNSSLSSDVKIDAVLVLSKAAGLSGMIAGQVMDLQNESAAVSLNEIESTYMLKTGEMIKAASVLGCLAANADESKIACARKFSEKIGLVFQIVDDILDVSSTSAVLGKPVGSDSENDKSTYVSLLGIESAADLAAQYTAEAVNCLDTFGNEADFLKEFAIRLLNRKN